MRVVNQPDHRLNSYADQKLFCEDPYFRVIQFRTQPRRVEQAFTSFSESSYQTEKRDGETLKPRGSAAWENAGLFASENRWVMA